MNITKSIYKIATATQSKVFVRPRSPRNLENVINDAKNRLKISLTNDADRPIRPNSELRILRSLKVVEITGKGAIQNNPMIAPRILTCSGCRYFDEYEFRTTMLHRYGAIIAIKPILVTPLLVLWTTLISVLTPM
ncbi:hypothetical protein TSUD_290370 [Trifolium subterraneum]|uniref:Uncharacterized protein n=1 Tax=Trifolium subterraneum TaxID=3900 RepID=A0A2Z6M4V6_TRISU|nr:hypothetical protein TSUD_290370 [Trifolium subterraneum]